MIFTLEALKAKKGDSLLLHWGDRNDPRLILIDGGPGGVYEDTLSGRLEELRRARDEDEPLPVEMLMVSHIDDDHVNGVLDLTADLIERDERDEMLPLDILTLWHNSFDDVVGNAGEELLASLAADLGDVRTAGAVPAGFRSDFESSLVLASVNQGRRLRKDAERLGLLLNTPFRHPADPSRPGLVRAPEGSREEVPQADGLSFVVVGPSQRRLEKLQKKWDTELPDLLEKANPEAEAAAYLDKSAHNLASIVVLAEAEVDGRTHRMLLTGDARGDDVLEGLEESGDLERGGTLHLDVLKVPHHGSDRNVETEFFRRLPADHYVISGDGTHHNPELACLEMISEARGDDEYTVAMTYRLPKLERFYQGEAGRGRNVKPVFRDDPRPSLRIDLGEPFER